MRWAEDVADQGCCVGADEGSDIGEIVLAVVAAVDAVLPLGEASYVEACHYIHFLKMPRRSESILRSNATSTLTLSLTALVHNQEISTPLEPSLGRGLLQNQDERIESLIPNNNFGWDDYSN